jgi:predicted dehydrogenase
VEQQANTSFRTVLIGCGGMGRNQAKILDRLEEFELLAVCDINEDNARQAAEATGAKVYTDTTAMLAEVKPEIVAICTANDTHAALTIQAAQTPGVRGVYCEKPMATTLTDGRAMVKACKDAGVPLVINHQRRIGADLIEARRLMEDGAIGEIKLVRGQCAGDILSDGTHLIDSLMWLMGDPEAEWVFGQVHRPTPEQPDGEATGKGYDARSGFRFGHVIEAGGLGVFQTRGGPRVEVFCGDMRESGTAYQDYQIFGTGGRLWRTGDRYDPNLFIQDAEGGTWVAGSDEYTYKPIPTTDGQPGGWRPVDTPSRQGRGGIPEGYLRLARWILDGEPHPMAGEIALRGFEVLMGIYESARLNRKIELPFQQDRFPLELMIESGQFEQD